MAAVEYLACGNIMSDRIQREDGSYTEWHMGGPAFFALSGIRLWTPNVKLVCRTGIDFLEMYGKWMDRNAVPMESVRFELEHHTRFTLTYGKDGSFKAVPHFTGEHLGYLKTSPREIDEACEGHNIKGIYLAQNTDRIFWEHLKNVKVRRGFKMMWEAEYLPEYIQMPKKGFLEQVRRNLSVAEMWSINHHEASDLFDIPADKDEFIINELQKLPSEMTFYRVGKRGSYVVTKTDAYFYPVVTPFDDVDPTGCGNNSTAAAMYAYVNGCELKLVGIIANISAGYNANQMGPFLHYTREDTVAAEALAERLLAATQTVGLK